MDLRGECLHNCLEAMFYWFELGRSDDSLSSRKGTSTDRRTLAGSELIDCHVTRCCLNCRFSRLPTCTSWLQPRFNSISILISLLSRCTLRPAANLIVHSRERRRVDWIVRKDLSPAQVKRVDWGGGEKVLRCLSVVFLGNWLHELIEFCFPANLVRFFSRLCGFENEHCLPY